MAKTKNIDLDDLLTPEQNVHHSEEGLADLYFLAIPRQTLEELNKAASSQSMTIAEVLSAALSLWMKENGRA